MRRVFILSVLLLLPLALMAQGPALVVSGQVMGRGTWDTVALARLGTDTVTRGMHGTTATFRGVALWKVLDAAGLTTDTTIKNQSLRKAVVVVARDGYRVVFSAGELHPDFGATDAVLAWSRDGQPLAADRGPFQLVLRNDRRPARSLYQVERIEVVAP